MWFSKKKSSLWQFWLIKILNISVICHNDISLNFLFRKDALVTGMFYTAEIYLHHLRCIMALTLFSTSDFFNETRHIFCIFRYATI